MSEIELVIGEARVWARGARTHWDGAPSVVPSSDGRGLVAGEPLTHQGQAASVVQHLAGDRIALRPTVVPSIADSAVAVLGSVFDNLRVGTPCDRITVVCPTVWGARERDVFATAAAGFAHEIAFEEIALRASELDPATQRSRRTIVIEIGLLSTAVSAVTYDHQGTHIESSEYEPTLGADDLRDDSRSIALAELLRRVSPGGQADVVQIFGSSDPAVLSRIAGVVEGVYGADAQLSSFAERDLFRVSSGISDRPVVPSAPEWMEPLRARAAAIEPRSRTPWYLAAAAAAVVIGIGAVVAVVAVSSGDPDPASTVAAATPTPSSSATSSLPRPTTTARSTTVALGKLESGVPAGWSRSDDPGRLILVSDNGARGRIIVTQKPVDAGAGYDEVAADLDAQIARKPAGTVTAVQRDVVFGGRPGLAYEERPADGSTVQWHVLIDRGTQISVGCQYPAGGRDAIVPACEAVTGSVRIAP
ncbi:type VII secretion-associated protein [Nocardia thailandica]|uniref:Type VII secretion-associated protein n=1 Tax=Nocardia thailandica TaxID=257275 RepID=A0ABW6PJN0_9NOCA